MHVSVYFYFFKSDFFQCNWHTRQCLHLTYTLMSFDKSKPKGNPRFSMIQNISITLETSLMDLCSWFPSILFASNTYLIYITINYFYMIKASYKWNHIGCILSHLASFTQYNVRDSSCSSISSLFLSCWVVFHCSKIPQFGYLFTTWWTFGLISIWGYYEQSYLIFI